MTGALVIDCFDGFLINKVCGRAVPVGMKEGIRGAVAPPYKLSHGIGDVPGDERFVARPNGTP